MMFKVFVAHSPEVEVDGATMLADVSGMLIAPVARHLLAAEGLGSVRPGHWYNQQAWLNVYRAIHEHLGDDSLYAIGRRIPYAADFPAEQMYDVPSALAAIDYAYHNSHRGGEIGHYRFVERGRDDFEVHVVTPYPSQFNLGIVSSLVERYRGRMHYHVSLRVKPANPHQDNTCIIGVAAV
jgi:hypothetical protein